MTGSPASQFLDRFDLEPWQRDVIEAYLQGRRVTISAPRRGRRHMGDALAAATIAAGEPITILSTTPERAEAARQRALALLDRLDAS